MKVSVVLSNTNLDIACGSLRSGGKGVKADSLYRCALPEGTLINGLVTDEDRLGSFISDVWARYALPKKNVLLAVDSTKFIYKRITLAKLSRPRLLAVIKNEFRDVLSSENPLFDYLTLKELPKSHSELIFASMVEAELVSEYDSLFRRIGLGLESVRPALACGIELFRRLEALRGKCAMVLVLDGNICTSYLLMDGLYIYSGNTRLIAPEGDEGFYSEISRAVSRIQQFYDSEKLDLPLSDVYLAGFADETVETLAVQIKQLYSLGVGPLADDVCVTLPPKGRMYGEGALSRGVRNYVYVLGNLLSWN